MYYLHALFSLKLHFGANIYFITGSVLLDNILIIY